MIINATLFIQVINFYLVYWLLRRFLFKPTITIIDQEASEKSSLMSILDQQQKSVEIQEKERERYALMGREYFRQNRPIVDYQKLEMPFILPVQESPNVVLLEEDYDVLIADIYTKLEEKIKHVH